MQLQYQLHSFLFASLATSGLARDQQPLSHTHLSTPRVPQLGFGTWNLERHNASEAVSAAIQTGYEHIDAAAIYGNEVEVGKGIKDGLEKTGLSRENLWVTSKLWNSAHGAENVEHALDQTLTHLGLDYLDLYLMHWPVSSVGGSNVIEFLDTWRGMEYVLSLGKVLHIGVSNFDLYQLSALQLNATVKPQVHQMELHPYLQQWDFVNWHRDLGIAVTAYSPLADLNPAYHSSSRAASTLNDTKKKKKRVPPSILKNGIITDIAEKRECTNAQVALAWGMGRHTSVIPKSQHEDRIVENYEAQECVLHADDYDRIERMGKHMHHRYNNPSKGWGVPLYEGLED